MRSRPDATPRLIRSTAAQNSQKVGRILLLSFVVLFSSLVVSCKTSDDALAAAKQMTATSKDLGDYYGALSKVVDDSIKLNEIQAALLSVPFNDQDRAQLSTTMQEIQKRADMARALQGVTFAFSQLSGSKAPSDVSDAASKLGQEMVSLKALPSGSPVPDAMGKAASLVVRLVQEHKEKEAAKALDATFSALAEFYAKERPAYDSLDKSYVTLAKSLANELVDRGMIDRNGLLAPALTPFGLSAQVLPSIRSQEFKGLAKLQIKQQASAQISAQQEASAGMEQALQDMSKRIHQLATENSLSLRGAPLSLSDVEKWIAEVT